MIIREDENEYRLKTPEKFAFLDSFCVKTTEWCKARITALALPDRSNVQFFVVPSITRECDHGCLNFPTGFNDTPRTGREHWTGFLKRCSTSVFEVLIFIPAMSHAVAKPFNDRRPDSE